MDGTLTMIRKAEGGWTEDADGKTLRWSGKYLNFMEALEVVNRIGAIAESHNHHPDIEFGWGYVRLALTTHDEGGLTQKDFELADALKKVLHSAIA
jgi:4a-hydroxytetrahydrobiopterin dehydratase